MIGTKRMDCTHPTEISTLDAADAIAYSCNSYVSEVATRLTMGDLVQTLRRAGLDSPSGLAREESTGRVTRPSSVAELQLEALGDWGIETTPLELLGAYRRLALRVKAGNLGTAAPIFDGLEGSVSYGMADAAHVQGFRIAGKTGTASRTSCRCEAAIHQRMRAIFGRREADTERQAIGKALSALSVLKETSFS
jgi:cell division protein FtsI/penicillin-binding protein 2